LAATRLGRPRADSPARVQLARLHLPDLPDPRPSALGHLGQELEQRTSLIIAPQPIAVRPVDEALFHTPFLVLSGDRGFALPPARAVERLRRFLTFGGFLLIDSAEGRVGGDFDRSVRRLLAGVLPENLPSRVASDHVLWRSFYVLRGVSGRLQAAPDVEGVERDRNLAVVYTQNDLCGALARDASGQWQHAATPDGESQREQAFRFAVNVVMYALCLDYKTEQAHIDFILRRRRQAP
jgi:hypothetical protein